MDSNNLALNALLATAFIYYAPTVWRTLVNNWKVCAKYRHSRDLMLVRLQLRSIPTVGTNSLLAPFIGPRRYLTHGHEMIQEGYDKVSLLTRHLSVSDLSWGT